MKGLPYVLIKSNQIYNMQISHTLLIMELFISNREKRIFSNLC